MAKQRVPEGPAPEPVVQRLRVRYAKRGRLRFSSTRDFQRALERAVRRAQLPVAFSAGFHPHPRISYANAAPTGTASEAEYFEIQLTRTCEIEQLRADLDEALPADLVILDVAESLPAALADRLEASCWQLDFAAEEADDVAAATATVLARDDATVSRMTKRGEREFDVRSAIAALTVDGPRVTIVLRHLTPLVRPDDVVTALTTYGALRPTRPPQITRLRQGPLLADGAIGDPLR
ncbi:TIGR03936 family radical SAM-associated protein [Flexivirga alba]|uniref:TIGR03936 family radical SAM-associated protein n=1 Tax=Flexivirga alba TaxID=702742 RepID=A0ABW2AM30_9MICO